MVLGQPLTQARRLVGPLVTSRHVPPQGGSSRSHAWAPVTSRLSRRLLRSTLRSCGMRCISRSPRLHQRPGIRTVLPYVGALCVEALLADVVAVAIMEVRRRVVVEVIMTLGRFHQRSTCYGETV